MIDNIFYINLDKRKDRNEKMITLLNERNLLNKAERISAIIGNDLKMSELKNLVSQNILKPQLITELENNNKPYLSGPEIGCALSHRSIWKLIVDKKIKEALILEDDCYINNNFIEKFNELKTYFPADYDIIFLGYTFFNPFSLKKINPYIYKSNLVYGTHGYLISNKGANKLLESFFPLEEPLDVQLCKKKMLNVYIVSPFKRIIFAPIPALDFDSDIQNIFKNKILLMGTVVIIFVVIFLIYYFVKKNNL